MAVPLAILGDIVGKLMVEGRALDLKVIIVVASQYSNALIAANMTTEIKAVLGTNGVAARTAHRTG